MVPGSSHVLPPGAVTCPHSAWRKPGKDPKTELTPKVMSWDTESVLACVIPEPRF